MLRSVERGTSENNGNGGWLGCIVALVAQAVFFCEGADALHVTPCYVHDGTLGKRAGDRSSLQRPPPPMVVVSGAALV